MVGSEEKMNEQQKKKQIKRILCRYYTYGITCPYRNDCYFIHDWDIKKYIEW